MRRFLLTFIAFCLASFLEGQDNIKNYVQENATAISFIEPDSINFEDLEKIGNAIGDSKVVMIGEQDHGDAPTFLAKSRLIKYLHEKKSFNVLAFESIFFGLNYEWDFVKDGKMDFDTFIQSNIYPIWTFCDACKQLFYHYLPATLKTNNPIQITGFDNQMYSKNIFMVLDSVFQSMNIFIAKSAEYKSEVLPLLNSWFQYTKEKDSSTNNKITSYLSEIKNEMLQKMPSDNFWIMVVENLIQESIEFKNSGKNYWKDLNTRDKQMALNLKWLSQVKYPQEKIIIWAHNYHISKYAGHYPENFLNAAKTMGSVFTEDTNSFKNTYIIGFTSYEGTAGRINQKIYKVNRPEKNSLENWINKKYNYAFVDFKKYNSSNSNNQDNFFMSGATKGNSYHKNQKAQWNHIFDGVFYIKEMYACQK